MKKNQITNKFKLVKWKNKLVPTLFGSVISLTPLMAASTDTKKQSTTTPSSGNLAASQGAQQSSLSTISDEDYNKMSKIVAYNDDNKLPNDDIEKIDGQNLYVVKKQNQNSVTNQVKLLRNIDKPNSIGQTKYYKIKISEVKKDKLTFATNIKFDLASIKTILRNSTSETFSQAKEIVVQISQNDLSDNKEITTFQFKVFGIYGIEKKEEKYNAKLIWKENSNSKFDLWLQYPPIKKHDGEDENIIKYEIFDSNEEKYVSQEIEKVFYSWSFKPNRSIYNKDLWKSAIDHIKKGKTDNDKKDLFYDFLKNEINLDLIKFKSEILDSNFIGQKNGIFFQYKLFDEKNSYLIYYKFDLEYYLSQAFEKYGNINSAFVSTKLKSDFSSLQLNAVLSSKDLGIEELIITNNKRFTYSYKIKENNDGVLKLEVTLKSRGDSKTREFFVIAKDKNESEKAKQQAVDDEKTRIEALAIFTINKSATVLADSLSKEELGFELDSGLQGATYEITHGEVSSNQATFYVSVKITKDGKHATATRKVAFTGIDEAAAKQQAVEDEKTRIEALAKLTITKTETVLANSLNEAELQLSSGLQGATYEITHVEVSTNQATFYVSVKITKDGKNAIARREVAFNGIDEAKDAAKQQAVDDEKTRIEALAIFTINKSKVVLADSLSKEELGLELDSGLQGATYEITHGEVSTNKATFNISIKITKDGKHATAIREVAFSGIDEAKDAAKQQAVDGEKTRIEALAKLTINKSKVVPADSLNEAELQLGSGLQGATYEITHGEVSSNQATFNISIKITKDGKHATAIREVAFSGIDEAKDAAKQQAVDGEKTRIEALAKLTINKSEVVPADSLNEAELQLGSGLQGATYEITHGEVSSNQATFYVSVKITKDGKNAIARREVAFSGIDEAAAKQQAVDGEKTRIEALAKLTITKTATVPTNSLYKAELQLGSGLQGATYEITHGEVSTNQATFYVSVKITKDGKNAIARREVAFSGIDEAKDAAKQQAVDDEKTRIEALAKLTINKSEVVPADSLNEAELQLGSGLQGATYEITHGEVSSNQATFYVSVKITKDGKHTTVRREVAFTGIDEAAAKQQAVDGEKTRIEALAKLTITKTETVLANSLNEAELQLSSGLQGATYEITHGEVSSNQATFDISVKITKDGKEATARREVAFSGIDEAAAKQQAVEDEKTRIEALAKLTITKTETVLANSLNEAELQLSSGLQGATYEITHGEVSSNQATFDISVKITKDGKEAIAKRKVSIIGIGETKQKFSSPKTSGLSKGVIVGITIGAFAFTLGFAFIVFKLLKLKKLNN